MVILDSGFSKFLETSETRGIRFCFSTAVFTVQFDRPKPSHSSVRRSLNLELQM